MNIKIVLAIILALIAGFITLNIFWWVIRHVFMLAFDLFAIIMIVVIALPFYFIIRKKLLS